MQMWKYCAVLIKYHKIIITATLATVTGILLFAILEKTVGEMTVTYLDVGQGDSIFIADGANEKMLIDGGPGRQVLRSLAKEMGKFDRTLNVVVATHSDSDHVGGILEVCENYKIENFLYNGYDVGKDYMVSVLECMKNQNTNIQVIGMGDSIEFTSGGILKFLSPSQLDLSQINPEDNNSSSIVSVLEYGNHKFMFMADAPKKLEDNILEVYKSEISNSITVLKVGHHGSDTSSGETLLSAIKPTYSVISVGKDNKYGHPKESVIQTLEKYSKYILSTELSGNIKFMTDGRLIDVTLEK